MSYVIEVSSGRGTVAVGTRTIAADRATIGRGADCSVALDDPHKYVSRLHAILDTQAGECMLSVVSKVNPVLLNGSRVEPGVKAHVETGDQLVIGEFKLIMRDVRPSGAPVRAAPSYAVAEIPKPQEADLPPAAKIEPDNLLEELKRRVKPAEEERAARVPEEPLPRPRVAKPPPPPPVDDDEDLAQPTFVGTLEDFKKLMPSAPTPPPVDDDEDLAQPTFVGERPEEFKELMPSAPSPAPPAAPAPALVPAPVDDDDAIFAEPTFVGERPKELTGVSLLKQYTEEPDESLAPEELKEAAELEGSAVDFDIFEEPTTSDERPSELAVVVPDAPPPSAAPSDDAIFDEPTFTGERPAEFAALAVGAPAAAPTAPDASTAPDAALAPAAASPEVRALVEAFLEGAGMRRIKVSDADAETFMRESGTIVRAAIDGLVGLLLARSEMKKEMRTEDRTMVASRNNNPLKLVANPEEAISYLFDSSDRTGGFLQPVQAVNDACEDLRAHEIALMAGMRAALIGSIKRLEPQLLEAEYDKKGGISLNRKAKLWETFVELHTKLTLEAEDDFLKVFGREFLGTYEAQVKRLKEGR